MLRHLRFACLVAFTLIHAAPSVPIRAAELMLPSLFGDHMVVQRDQPIRVWGWTDPNIEVMARLADRQASSKSDANGRFDIQLKGLPAGGPFELVVTAQDQEKRFQDVLSGEVWICSGQSNMQWSVGQSNDAALECLAANNDQIRLISVPQVGVQEPQRDFNGSWSKANPDTVRDFSAVGYFFGRQLQQTLNVPIGLIDDAWGGSAAEAWVPKDVLDDDGRFQPLMEQWETMMANYDFEKLTATWQQKREAWVAGGKKGNAPRAPRNMANGNQRPANIYNGVLHPTVGYGIRGVIWYQGESNSSRAYQYRDLFPLMIQTWRELWDQGDFPFYYVQLADFMAETESPAESAWAELREAQTMTMDKLDNVGQAVIINLGEASDIHPKNKQDVAKRLARWALAKDYGYEISYRSPQYTSMTQAANGRLRVDFDHVGEGLDTFDTNRLVGFTIAGDDKVFHDAEAKMVDRDTVEVWSTDVDAPVAVRYGWADNPVCNVQSKAGLPLTPFRTDDWNGVTADRVTR